MNNNAFDIMCGITDQQVGVFAIIDSIHMITYGSLEKTHGHPPQWILESVTSIDSALYGLATCAQLLQTLDPIAFM